MGEAEHLGWLSLLPPALTVALALATKRVLASLLVGIVASLLLLTWPNPLRVPFATIDYFIAIATDRDNFILILFSLMVGGLLQLIRDGGGFKGFANAVISRQKGSGTGTANGLVALIGAGMFLEVWSNVLVNGATTSPLYDRLGLSRARLAYYIHTISVCVVAMATINSWGAFYIGLLNAQGIEGAFAFVVASIPYMVYNWVSLALVLVVMVTGFGIGPMRRFDQQARERAAATAQALPGEESQPDDDSPGRAIFMILPIAALLVSVFVALYLTGGGDILAGDGGISITYAVTISSIVAAVLLIVFKVSSAPEVEESYLKGMGKFFDIGILIVFALSLGALTRDLGTGVFLAELAQGGLPLFLLPALVFLLGAVMSFATGTSYGTFSIMVPIGVPIALSAGLDPHLMFAACISGGLFGDNTSPISDTTIMTSLATEVAVVDHVSSQLPFALISAGVSFAVFILLGAVL